MILLTQCIIPFMSIYIRMSQYRNEKNGERERTCHIYFSYLREYFL